MRKATKAQHAPPHPHRRKKGGVLKECHEPNKSDTNHPATTPVQEGDKVPIFESRVKISGSGFVARIGGQEVCGKKSTGFKKGMHEYINEISEIWKVAAISRVAKQRRNKSD